MIIIHYCDSWSKIVMMMMMMMIQFTNAIVASGLL